MKTKDFARLTACIKQAGRIRRGRQRAARTVEIGRADVRGIRDRLGRSQAEFALMIGVSIATLQNWEQGRRRPVGPARALLKVAASNPRLVMQALASGELRRPTRSARLGPTAIHYPGGSSRRSPCSSSTA